METGINNLKSHQILSSCFLCLFGLLPALQHLVGRLYLKSAVFKVNQEKIFEKSTCCGLFKTFLETSHSKLKTGRGIIDIQSSEKLLFLP